MEIKTENKIMSADEAVRLISDGATVQITGAALVCSSAKIFRNIEKSFLETGHPRDLCIVSEGSPSSDVPGHKYFEHLVHPGILRRVVGGHMGYHQPIFPLIRNNQIEGYNVSQGILSIMTNEGAAGKDGYLTKVGLRTQQDPRYEGCKLNEGMITEDIVELRMIDNQEYLWYKIIRPDIAVLKGSYADVKGNITFEAEPSNNDALNSAMSVKNHGGKVIVFVKGLKDEHFKPRTVNIPYFLVDAIIVDQDHIQAAPHLAYSPYFSNEERCSEEEMQEIIEQETKNSVRKRELAAKIIARRAAMELYPTAVVNVGFGIPQMISGEAINLGIDINSVIMTTETGIIGGVQLPSVFSVSMNADAVYDQASQFRFYEGGGLDLGFLGALEIDKDGNVNVCKKGQRLAGVGGFNFIVFSAKKLVYCFPFMIGSGYNITDGKRIPFDGKSAKIVNKVESISMNARVEYENRKSVLYVTERCVFQLSENGIELIEIAPGIDLKKDILDLLDFIPSVSKDLKEMPNVCFENLI